MLKLHATKDYLVNVTSPDSTFSIHLETSNYSTIEFNDDPSYEVSSWLFCVESVAWKKQIGVAGSQ